MDYISEHLVDIVIGFVLSVGISFFAYKKRSLAFSGMLAAVIIGIVISSTGGLYFMTVMIVFFISSSLLSKISADTHKDALRTYKQVLANGIVGMVMSILYVIQNDEIYKLLYTASIAISTADTWGSEIGRITKGVTKNIVTWKTVESGLSGGVSVYGSIATVLGSLFISAFYRFHPVVILLGIVGSIVDSILGTFQVKYQNQEGHIFEDKPKGEKVYVIGIEKLSNTMVNFVSNILVIGGYVVIRMIV